MIFHSELNNRNRNSAESHETVFLTGYYIYRSYSCSCQGVCHEHSGILRQFVLNKMQNFLDISPLPVTMHGFRTIKTGGERVMAEMSKTAKAATKKAIVNQNVPQCCAKPMQAAKMMSTTGK